MLIVVFGLPGSGKSYFARNLALTIHAAYLNSDELRKELFDKPRYTKNEKQKVYLTLFTMAESHLQKQEDIILDATFHKKERRTKVELIAQKHQTGLIWIEVVADEEIIRQRLNQTRPDSDADFEIYQKIKASFEPFSGKHLRLTSTNDNLEAMLKKAIEWIKNEAGRY